MADLQQRTPAWHAARQGKLTASNLGACLGMVSYTSRAIAFRRALGIDKFEGNVATEWGTANEPNAIVDYQTKTGNVVKATGLHVHPDLPWLAGSPDGFVGSLGMIEVKCPYYHREGGRLHKEVPMHYYLQVNALLEICNREWCDYVCWTPEGMVVYNVFRDRMLFDFLTTYYGQFYSAVQAKAEKPPPLSREDKDAIVERVKESISENVKQLLPPSEAPLPCRSDDDDDSPRPPLNVKRQRTEKI